MAVRVVVDRRDQRLTELVDPSRAGVELRLTTSSRALRRSLGPTAWAILEEALLEGGDDGGAWVVRTNVRRLADALGVSKDTAARAVKRSTAYGILVHHPGGHDARGRFSSAYYEIRLEQLAGIVVDSHRVPPGPARGRRTQRRSGEAQPSLFDVGGTQA